MIVIVKNNKTGDGMVIREEILLEQRESGFLSGFEGFDGNSGSCCSGYVVPPPTDKALNGKLLVENVNAISAEGFPEYIIH